MSPKNLSRRSAGFSLIELLIVVAIIGIIATIALPSLQVYLKRGRETGAVQSLKNIHNFEASYNSSHNKYGTLQELVTEGLLTDKRYASGKAISQYIYSDSDVANDKYCIHANRESNGSADRDFNIIEDGVVRYLKSSAKGNVAHGEGTSLSDSEGEGTKPAEAPKP